MTRKLALRLLIPYDAGTMTPSKIGPGRKVKTSVYLDKKRLETLKAISDRTLIPMSVLIRKGIDLVIVEYKTKL